MFIPSPVGTAGSVLGPPRRHTALSERLLNTVHSGRGIVCARRFPVIPIARGWRQFQ